jgi:hypothetical protein
MPTFSTRVARALSPHQLAIGQALVRIQAANDNEFGMKRISVAR